MRRLWRNNGLSLVLFALFAACLAGQSVTGHRAMNAVEREHGSPPISYGQYLHSAHFLEATAENWESEFLQMAFYVVLTAFLFQRGSAESKDPDATDEVDRDPDPARPGAPAILRRGAVARWFYRNSLSIALFTLFLISFVLHAIGGSREYNNEHADHGDPHVVTPLQYMGTAQFWFESLQNWQSEFLAVLAIVTLSIFLRQQGSPESKPVDAPHTQTGG